MKAYLIANVEIKDAEVIKKYLKASPKILEKYSGKFLVRGGEICVTEGDWSPQRLVVVEFESMEKAKNFWNSEDYKPLKALRQAASKTDMLFVNGL